MKSKILPLTTLTLMIFTAAITSDSAFDMSTQSDRKSVSVTIYNGGIGLVRETRLLNLSKGIRTLRFEDVPSQIIPQTVRVKGEDPKKLTVFEQNYEYDLISPERLMDKYIGKEVTLYNETKEKTTSVKATLISNNGNPVYKIGDEISLGYNGRVTVPTIPENLYAKPTLVWKLKNDVEKEQTLEVSYQTHGLGWSADYILVLDKEEELCGLNSWVTLNNNSGAEFKNATLQLVAGKVNLISNQANVYANQSRTVKKTMMKEYDESSAAPEFNQENLSEYYLYTLDQPTNIGYNQTKQVQLFQSEGIEIKKFFVFENLPMYEGNEKNFNNATIKYIFKNAKKNNLGRPLPLGTIRVFKADSKGRQQLLGEDTIDHTPENEEVKIKTGQAFDVVANGKRLSNEVFKLSRGDKSTYSAEIRNRKKETIEVRFYTNLWGDWNITKSSHKFTKESATKAYTDVTVKANETVTVEYTVETKYQ
ncbi:hypothetical protein EHQ68_14580 [Leptospira congkakensis]|uniref:DUF4139 domain-containing protein n=1 Tax=Leptospira congkakensis TaxID=2484932 RepID=A0A4Z1A6K8_9LEPT|nr:DUF4139 domain-containing protein [Leptospira congkakensis]TGL86535.1 hypothetical protein EHQ68_14580 [Leptospira congkakensis]TGL93919.1 hypothetical protein EHQ69_05450 [Leptospira congkakensis]TGL94675.1 hypothetical protein EHQ70_15345 [Leptospira congkakensis]